MQINPDAKVVMCSALGSEKIIAECIMAGAKSYIVKPFDQDTVVSTLTKVIG